MDSQELIYLDTPISDSHRDVIGVGTYVDKLNAVIDAGAQMIAVTSPFGSGKTSIIELLERKREGVKQPEKIVKISMWSQLHGDSKKVSTIDLHRSFLYQLISQIDHKRGTYISRRLSPNYGLIKLHASKRRYWVLFVLSLLLFCFSWILNTYPEEMASFVPIFANSIDSWKAGLLLVGAVLALFVVTKAEIIYSTSQKAEIKREIEFAEIVDIYRAEILKYSLCRKNESRVFNCKKRYIVIIEDLDRTEDHDAIESFLKELRKYYVPQKDEDNIYQNKVAFIVNVKPEALLKETITPDESLYEKLFDNWLGYLLHRPQMKLPVRLKKKQL